MSAGRFRPTPYQTLWRNFLASISPSRRAPPRKLVGQDYLGNRYFEQETPLSQNRKVARSFEAANRQVYDMDHEARWEEIPPEWEAWLRRKRKDPPTPEEIEQNIALMLQKQENGRRLEEEKRLRIAQNPDSLPVAAENPDAKVTFPRYGDMDTDPTKPQSRLTDDPVIRDRTIR